MTRKYKEDEQSHGLQPLETPYFYNLDQLSDLSIYLRKKVFELCIQSGSGHIGGNSSSVELMTALYFGGILRYDPGDLKHPDRDRVLVRGHLGPLRYSIFSLLGSIEEAELSTYREFGSRLQGHEEYQQVAGIDITPSGSLGMLLSYGVGSALASKERNKLYKTYVFLGDGEEQEGNVAEAARHAGALNLENLIVILDKNGKQLSNPTSDTDAANLMQVWSGYGFTTFEIKDGHDLKEVVEIFNKAKVTPGPVFVLANTIKGFGLERAEEHFSGYHTVGVCPPEIAQAALGIINRTVEERLININNIKAEILQAQGKDKKLEKEPPFQELVIDILPTSETSRKLDAAQGEYFIRLADFLQNQGTKLPFFILTADVMKKSDVDESEIRRFANFYNVGIREQHSMGMAHGLSLSYPESRIIINAFDAFSYRSIDQLNSLIHGQGNVIIIGDIAGITNGKNGKTHQAAGQPGALLSMPGLTVLEPSDVTDLFNAFNWAIGKSRGAVYIRTHRSESFDIPKIMTSSENTLSYYLARRPPENIDLTLVSSGLTASHSLEAAEILESQGVATQVINVINQNSLDQTFADLLPIDKPVLTIFNGAPRILQASVSRAVLEHSNKSPSKILGHGFEFGTTGSVQDLLHHYQLDAEGIASIALNRLINLR